MNQIAVQASGLTRFFGNKAVVQQASFALPVGTITGLLGINGTGKSTIIKMLLGLLAPTRGSCSLLGVDSRALTGKERASIGYTVEGHFLYGSMTVRDTELLQADSFPKWESSIFQSTIGRFGIDPKSKVRTLSRGQRAGVSIALTMSSLPELLILDDPALGLDPVSRRALNETLLAFMESGKRTILVSSQLLEDVERIADRVLIMVDGRIIVNSTIDHFLERVSTWSCTTTEDLDCLPHVPGLVHVRRQENRLTLNVVDVDAEAEAALKRIGGSSLVKTTASFDESVLAYLSRSRVATSFLTRIEAPSLAKP